MNAILAAGGTCSGNKARHSCLPVPSCRACLAPSAHCLRCPPCGLQLDVVLNLVTGVYDEAEQRVVYSLRHTS